MVLSAFKQISAHNELLTFVRHAIQGRDDKIRIKKKMVMNGNTPYGYKKVRGGSDTKLQIDEEETIIVQDIFDMYIGRNGTGRPMSLKAICRYLNERGVLPPSKKPELLWCPIKISRILPNEIYDGVYWWVKTHMVNKGFQQRGVRVKQPRDKWIRLDVPELAIIEQETFDSAQ